ncbi:MAG: hypothetical protein ACJAS9_001061 [Polaribacter sp.]|jgi:hypothetical protein
MCYWRYTSHKNSRRPYCAILNKYDYNPKQLDTKQLDTKQLDTKQKI